MANFDKNDTSGQVNNVFSKKTVSISNGKLSCRSF